MNPDREDLQEILLWHLETDDAGAVAFDFLRLLALGETEESIRAFLVERDGAYWEKDRR